MTPFVAFGYRKTKTDKHKLEIDPSAGSVVQDIFKMKLRGMSQDAIANRLKMCIRDRQSVVQRRFCVDEKNKPC